MTITKCPKCGNVTEINISHAIDEHGEVYICPNCKYQFRYAPNG